MQTYGAPRGLNAGSESLGASLVGRERAPTVALRFLGSHRPLETPMSARG